MLISIPKFNYLTASRSRAPAEDKKCALTFIIATPHARCKMPDWHEAVDPNHQAYDIGSFQLGEQVAQHLNGTHHFGKHSRLYVDLNRDIKDPSAIPSPEQLDDGDLAGRLFQYTRYLKTLDTMVAGATVNASKVCLLNLHTFTRTPEGAKPRRVDIGVPVPKNNAGPALRFYECLKARTLTRSRLPFRKTPLLRVRKNLPYSGSSAGNFLANRFLYKPNVTALTVEICDEIASLETVSKILSASLISFAFGEEQAGIRNAV